MIQLNIQFIICIFVMFALIALQPCVPRADTAPHHRTDHVSALRAAAGWAGRPRAAGQCGLAQLPAGEHAGVPGPAPGLGRGHPGARLAQRHLRQERTRTGQALYYFR